MATGVKPRDEDTEITKKDLENFEDAMKNKQFRELLVEYCEEVRDPANQALYQKEMTQLEKERGYDVTFINPKGGYVIKTSVAGDKKAFINICSNENVGTPSYKIREVNGNKGMDWKIPYSIIPPRYDFDNKRKKCVLYDVVFHPDTLRMAEVNKRFRELVNKTAFDGLKEAFNIDLDGNNFRFPKALYKGMMTPAVIRKEDPNYTPSTDENITDLDPDVLDKLYPQRSYSHLESTQPIILPEKIEKKNEQKVKPHNGYTTPKYSVKQQKNVELQDFTNDRDAKQHSAIPSKIVVEINLPLLSSTKECTLDVQEKALSLISEKPAKYKLSIQLPYSVNEQNGNAQFDKTKRVLKVTLPVIKRLNSDFMNSRVDSGVDSEEFSGSQSDEDVSEKLVHEISSTPAVDNALVQQVIEDKQEPFLNPTMGYILPPYTHNVLDDMVAFTFHVKNTEPDSVTVLTKGNSVHIKFTSVGSGFTPVHYAALVYFTEGVEFHNVCGEAWDNNVILQMEFMGNIPHDYKIGLDEDSLICEYFSAPVTITPLGINKETCQGQNDTKGEVKLSVVEVTNSGTETNIVVISNKMEKVYDDLDEAAKTDQLDGIEIPMAHDVRDSVFSHMSENYCTKGILRKPMRITRSLSESSVEVASSMDYISSDCIPEESSLKKTVRFNDVIARQFYRYNSSIEGQKKKNQRRKSKKRNQELRKSESEGEDDVPFNKPEGKDMKQKSALKLRRDSGLADTSDAETDFKSSLESPYDMPTFDDTDKPSAGSDVFSEPSDGCEQMSVMNIVNGNTKESKKEFLICESEASSINESTAETSKLKKSEPVTNCDVKHNTQFYDPDKLNRGRYLEVQFKNDLIFDLDM